MEQNKLYPADDYSQNYYTWPEYLHATGPLTEENVFDYFAQSVYYDKQSNNQVLRMQTQHTGVPLANEAEELKRFTGIEFAVVHAQPPLFIIHKRERLSPDEVRPLVAYFIIHNRIYISPDVYTLISNRLLTSLHALQTSLNVLRDHRPAYAPRTGFVWPIKGATTTTSTDAAKKRTHEGGVSTPDIRATPTLTDPSSKPESSSAPTGQSPTKRKQNNMLLLNAMRTTALHSSRSFVLPTAVSESTVPDTPAASATAGRSSATPAPSQSASTPKPPGSQDPLIRRESVVGKKRKKRASVVAV